MNVLFVVWAIVDLGLSVAALVIGVASIRMTRAQTQKLLPRRR